MTIQTKPNDVSEHLVPKAARLSAPRCSKSNTFHWLLTLITLSALGYIFYSTQQITKETLRYHNVLQNRISKVSDNQSRLSDTLLNKLNTLQKNNQEIHIQLDALKKEIDSTLNTPLMQSERWVLLKVRYYLELAQINIHWHHDDDSIKALLTQANNVLITLHQAGILSIRQAIASDIQKLTSEHTMDITGLMSQLDAAQQAVSTLPLSPSIINNNMPKTNTTSPKAWRDRLKDSLNLLEKLVVIRHHTDNLQPLLTPLHQTVLRESIRLNLQEAQWAILEFNNPIYQSSLQQAIRDIHRMFDLQSKETQSLLNELTQLSSINFEKNNTLELQSLPLLDQYINQLNGSTMTPSSNLMPKSEQSS